jgi:hypothetical protein
MSHKKHGQFTTSPEWARHLRPVLRRFFWKSERRAAREFARSEAGASADRLATGTVEELIHQIESWPPAESSAELWVPERLTLDGDPIAQDIAMAIVVDKLLKLNYFPDGFSANAGGRLNRYNRE